MTVQEAGPLELLSGGTTKYFNKNGVIYDRAADEPTGINRIYQLVEGYVKVVEPAENDWPVVVDVYRPGDFFGELAFGRPMSDRAIALSDVRVKYWMFEDFERGMGASWWRRLWEIQLDRNREAVERIRQSCSLTLKPFVAWSLLRFAERLGTPVARGIVEMPALTHELLARYAGTSREGVTAYLIQFRRDGLIRYDRRDGRKIITVMVHALAGWLASERKERAA